jgi:two-component system, OmpR family, phosphate regulon sensor histidine kinase PhoR
MRRANSKLYGIFWLVFVMLLLTLLFSAAFYLTDYFYKITNLKPPALLVQIINSFLGLIFTSLIISIFSRFIRQRQFDSFQQIIQALERIARGDFNIRLEHEHNDGFLHGLVESVNKMAQDLGQMENMRQEFISNISHEIQSPLTSIRGFAQALQNDELSLEQRHHYLEIIEMESNRLSRLTDDLLKLASLDAEQVKFDPQPYRLDQQIRSVILTCEPQWRDKALGLEVVLDEISICADADLLNQVWMNLLHNSIKFTPQAGTIKISLSAQGDQVAFRIADTGIGISAEAQVHIFERFYKADKSRTRSAGGSGLGLAIVKKIVDLHHGTLDLESELGKGTIFTIHLPLEQK